MAGPVTHPCHYFFYSDWYWPRIHRWGLVSMSSGQRRLDQLLICQKRSLPRELHSKYTTICQSSLTSRPSGSFRQSPSDAWKISPYTCATRSRSNQQLYLVRPSESTQYKTIENRLNVRILFGLLNTKTTDYVTMPSTFIRKIFYFKYKSFSYAPIWKPKTDSESP